MKSQQRPTRIVTAILIACLLAFNLPAFGRVPQLINFQGHVTVDTTIPDGPCQFKFALVNGTGTITYWSNDGTSQAGSQPNASVTLLVSKGFYSLQLGDTTLNNMGAIPAGVFNNDDVRLRVWFNDGTHGSQLLTPDQRIVAVGYAIVAGTVDDGAITSAKIATGAVGSSQIAAGAVGAAQLASGALPLTKISQGGAAGGQVLKWSGSEWIPGNASGGLDTILRTTAQGPPTETNAGSSQWARNVAHAPTANENLTVTVTGARLGSPVVLTVPVLDADASTQVGDKVRAALAGSATIQASYITGGPGNFIDIGDRPVSGSYYGPDSTMKITVAGTAYGSIQSVIITNGVKTTTETSAPQTGTICRVGDSEPYDYYVASGVSPTKWRKMLVSETGVVFPNSANTFVIRNNGANGEGRDVDKWEIWNSGCNAAPSLTSLHSVPSGLGRNNWSQQLTWNVRFDQSTKSWREAVVGHHMQIFELGNEGISMHCVKDGGVEGYGLNTVSHMVWAIRPNELHGPSGELAGYQTTNPVIQRKISDICIFREKDSSNTPNSDGWLDLDNPFAVYASDSRNNVVPPNGSVAFRTWGTQNDAQSIVFDRATGPSSTQTAPVAGQKIGGMRFRVWDGKSWIGSTSIHGELEATVGSGDAPVTTVIQGENRDDGNALVIRKGNTDVARVSRTGSAKFNSLNVESWPVFANEAAAIAGGVKRYETYRTEDGALRYVSSILTDTDAVDYVSAVETSLSATLDTGDKEAINDFILAEKDAGRWASIKRLWLPVWGNASANAIDLKEGAAGAFTGGVTHAAGYVQGNGTTGYFNTNISPSALGLTNASAFLGVLVSQAGSGSANQGFIGVYPAGTGELIFYGLSTESRFECMSNATTVVTATLPRASQSGILTASRFGGNSTIRRRTAAGAASIANTTLANNGNVPTSNLFAMAGNNFGSPAMFSDARFGAFVIGSGLSVADTDAMSANLRKLWETLTGQTLP